MYFTNLSSYGQIILTFLINHALKFKHPYPGGSLVNLQESVFDRKVSVMEKLSSSFAIPTQVHLAAYYVMANINEIIF
jgi:hypothetical protein